jgi:hypothetical protein
MDVNILIFMLAMELVVLSIKETVPIAFIPIEWRINNYD